MRFFKGLISPAQYFEKLNHTSPKIHQAKLTNRFVLISSTVFIMTYMSIKNLIELELIDDYNFLAECVSLSLAVSFYLFGHGLFIAIAGQLFKVREHPSSITASIFSAHLMGLTYGAISLILFVSIIGVAEEASLLVLVAWIAMYARALIAATKVSSQSTFFEAVTILLCGSLITIFSYSLTERLLVSLL